METAIRSRVLLARTKSLKSTERNGRNAGEKWGRREMGTGQVGREGEMGTGQVGHVLEKWGQAKLRVLYASK